MNLFMNEDSFGYNHGKLERFFGHIYRRFSPLDSVLKGYKILNQMMQEKKQSFCWCWKSCFKWWKIFFLTDAANLLQFVRKIWLKWCSKFASICKEKLLQTMQKICYQRCRKFSSNDSKDLLQLMQKICLKVRKDLLQLMQKIGFKWSKRFVQNDAKYLLQMMQKIFFKWS